MFPCSIHNTSLFSLICKVTFAHLLVVFLIKTWRNGVSASKTELK